MNGLSCYLTLPPSAQMLNLAPKLASVTSLSASRLGPAPTHFPRRLWLVRIGAWTEKKYAPRDWLGVNYCPQQLQRPSFNFLVADHAGIQCNLLIVLLGFSKIVLCGIRGLSVNLGCECVRFEWFGDPFLNISITDCVFFIQLYFVAHILSSILVV